MTRPVLALLALCYCTFLLGLGHQAITDSDEAYYAEAAREMVESGDWLTPHYNYQDRWEKPALYYWLTAGTYALMGTSEWAARLWSALSGAGLTLLTWAAARRMLARNDVAWLAGAIVATSFGYVAMARQALPDLPLTLCITLATWSALRATEPPEPGAPPPYRWWALAGLGAGLGFLTKGPVALVVPGVVLLPIWWRERRSRGIALQGVLLAALVFMLIGFPWYVAMWSTHGAAYLRSFFVGDNLERFATTRFNGPRGFGFYVPIILGGLVPWSVYLVALPATSIREVFRRRRILTGTEWRLLLWAAMPVLFYTLSVGKQPRYVLPVLPPLAILLARSIAARIDARPAAGTVSALGVATWVTVVLFGATAVALVRMRPILIGSPPAATWVGAAVLVTGAAALAWVAAAGRWRRLPAVMVLAAAGFALTVQFGAIASRRPEPVEQIAGLVRSHRTGQEPVGQFGVFVKNLVFYTGVSQRDLFDNPVAAADFLRSTERVLLVVDATDVPGLQQATGISLRTLGRVDYFNAANVRLRTLLDPDPSANVATVLLVTNR